MQKEISIGEVLAASQSVIMGMARTRLVDLRQLLRYLQLLDLLIGTTLDVTNNQHNKMITAGAGPADRI